MAEYSQIEKIYIKNFRNLSEVAIDFSESPIVALVGGNEAGKTSVLKAFEVCALHYNSRSQKEYIRKGTQYFGVVIQLADGTSVIRMKTNDVNKYEVRYPNGQSWATSKVSEGLPLQVSQVMGMVEEPETREYLQVRTYEDQLLLVYTPSSVNYKVMYDALKVGQITRAIKNGTEEANSIRSEIATNYSKISICDDNLRSIKVFDLSNAITIRESVRKLKKAINGIEKLIKTKRDIEDMKSRIGILSLIESYDLNEIDEMIAVGMNNASNSMYSMNNTIKELNTANKVVGLSEIDVRLPSIMEDAIMSKRELNEISKKKERLKGIESMHGIDEHILNIFNNVMSSLLTVNGLSKTAKIYRSIEVLDELDKEESIISIIEDALSKMDKCKEYREEIDTLSIEIDAGNKYLKSIGVSFETCPNCGTDIMIDYNNI